MMAKRQRRWNASAVCLVVLLGFTAVGIQPAATHTKLQGSTQTGRLPRQLVTRRLLQNNETQAAEIHDRDVEEAKKSQSDAAVQDVGEGVVAESKRPEGSADDSKAQQEHPSKGKQPAQAESQASHPNNAVSDAGGAASGTEQAAKNAQDVDIGPERHSDDSTPSKRSDGGGDSQKDNGKKGSTGSKAKGGSKGGGGSSSGDKQQQKQGEGSKDGGGDSQQTQDKHKQGGGSKEGGNSSTSNQKPQDRAANQNNTGSAPQQDEAQPPPDSKQVSDDGGAHADQSGTVRLGSGRKRKSAPINSLADTVEDEWWLNVTTDVSKCKVEDAAQAQLIQEDLDGLSPEECRTECKITEGCNAWFSCTDTSRDCYDWQTQKTVPPGRCLLMSADIRPQPEPKLSDVKKPFDFFSYRAGYIKDNIYLRPPLVAVATAVAGCDPEGPDFPSKHWEYADWLGRLGIANKQDFARLHGFDFILETVKDGRTKMDVIMDLLDAISGSAYLKYLLWMEPMALVVKGQTTFPFEGRYVRLGKQIVMYGDTDMVAEGDVTGFEPGVMLLQNVDSVRDFLQRVNTTKDDEEFMREGLPELKKKHQSDKFRNALAIIFKREKQLNVYFETAFCFACFWADADLESPTMFVTHFSGVSHCNDYSLSKDDPKRPPYNKQFINNYRLSKCKHTQVLDTSEPRVIAEGLPEPPDKVHMQAFVILPGNFNKQPDVVRCRKKCRATRSCNAWVYCRRKAGCDDGHLYRPDWYPYQACELLSIPHNLPLDMNGRGPVFSSAAHGFLLKKFRGSKQYSAEALQRLTLPTTPRPEDHPNLIMLSAIPQDPCAFPIADFINKLSIINKQDYCHRHSFEFHFSSEMIDPAVSAPNWNKAQTILRALRETPRDTAEWIMWVDIDTALPDMSVLPRFKDYEGKDLVVWGNPDKILEGDLNAGINCGVLLIRNTDWSLRFFEDVGQYGYMPMKKLQTIMRPILQKEVFPLLSGFYDTPFIVWLLKTRPYYFEKVFFEDQIGLNRHWLEMDWGNEDVETMITHYAGCTFCDPPTNKLDHDVIDACSKEFFKAYALGKCNLDAHYLNTTQCNYEKADLHDLSIRLGQ